MKVDQQQIIEATQVPQQQRLQFLPKHFGMRHMMRGEALIYGWARRLVEGYTGGYWEFFDLNNGGFFVVPNGAATLHVRAPNGFEADMAPEAAGIVVTLYALCQIANETEEDSLIEKYHALREYAVHTHPQGASIAAAID